MSNKKPSIDYTSRDYSSIRSDLLGHIKRYYSDIYKDFNEASFGSLMVDTVSYIGDMLSFYLDYQANESFIDTAIEYDNVIRQARALGYKFRNNPSSYGKCTFYIVVPADLNANKPDLRYLPVLEKGSIVSTSGNVTFTLTENVNFSDPNNEVVVAAVDDNPDSRIPTFFAVKATGTVVSGELAEAVVEVGDFTRFLKIEVPGENITEIVSVADTDGNSYHEVEYLSQNTVFREVSNRKFKSDTVPSILKTVAVPRRFIVEQLSEITYIQFGYGSEKELLSGSIADPSNISLNIHGKNFVSSPEFDPMKLTTTDKFGVAPANTSLHIIYRVNSSSNVNAAAYSINKISSPNLYFDNRSTLRDDMVSTVVNSLEVENEFPILGDISLPKSDEVRRRAIDSFATQHRAVTVQDYKSCVYLMPDRFGAIKRCAVYRDMNDLQRNINIYVLAEDSEGYYTQANNTVKTNLKKWINSVRMIADSVDIYDAKVVNLGIEFEAMVEAYIDKEETLKEAVDKISEDLQNKNNDIGESFHISDIYKSLKDIPGIIDVKNIRLHIKSGGEYSEESLKLQDHMDAHGRVLNIPKDYIWEVKYPRSDIIGVFI